MKSSRLFAPLALTTALLTIGLIVFGAIVRVTDSGLGCGNDWPLCNGTFLPPFDNVTAWIEWLHRLFAMLIGILGIGMLVTSWIGYRKVNSRVLKITIVAAGLYIVVAGLGRFVVAHDLNPSLVTLHLGTAMLLLACFVTAFLFATYRPAIHTKRDNFTVLVYVTTALTFVIVLTGALVRGSGATLACTDWPLCNGQIFPFEQGQLATIHMLHRIAVAGLGIVLALLVWSALVNRRGGNVRTLAVSALLVYLMQAGVGAMFVLSLAGPLWGAAHVGLAATIWVLLVTLSVIETMNSRESDAVTEWQSKPLPN
jgi:heme A synthase